MRTKNNDPWGGKKKVMVNSKIRAIVTAIVDKGNSINSDEGKYHPPNEGFRLDNGP